MNVVSLKKLAVEHAHLEIVVITTDSTARGCNYFSSHSSVTREDVYDAEEISQILVGAASLKKLAVDYAHPELGVATSDPTTLRTSDVPLLGQSMLSGN